jgi:hypothetical protein
VLVATWQHGLFVVGGETIDQELRNESVRALAPDGRGGALGIINGRSLRRRGPDGVWSTITTTELELACCVAVGDVIYVGSDDARAVAFAGDDVLVSASADHFAAQGAIYRRRVDGDGPLVAIAGGLPASIDGIADTGCIATHGSAAALADRKGNLYVSADVGRSWARHADGLPPPSSLLIVKSQ